MEITKIEQTGKKCRLYLNDAPAFCLYPSEVRKFALAPGQELTKEKEQEILETCLDRRAKKRCLLILKSSDKTEKQLRDKLRQDEYPQEVIDDAIEYVKSYGYVDDFRYACRYIETMQESRSALRLKTDLQKRGIDTALIEEALEQTMEADEQAQIRALMHKRGFEPGKADSQERQKMIRFLLARGYRYSQISKEIDIDGEQV